VAALKPTALIVQHSEVKRAESSPRSMKGDQEMRR